MSVLGMVLLWGGFLVLFYTYFGYPLVLALAARFRTREIRNDLTRPDSVALVMSVRNGESQIRKRLGELIGLTAGQSYRCEIILVSDGSTDGTAAVASEFADQGVRVFDLVEGVGKAAAISHAVAQTQCEIIVFADVRQRWNDETIGSLLGNFQDSDVGAVSGELVLESRPDVLAGVSTYWRYEKWIRRTESRIHSQIGVTGAVAAVRRECFRPIPQGTLLDDVYWPMQVGLQRKRIVFESCAKAFDILPEHASDEFRRKVRTLTGNFQLVTLCPRLLVPIANPLWGRFMSHKMMRLACPWAMIAMVIGAVMARDLVSLLALAAMAGFVAVAIAGLITNVGNKNRLVSAASSFLMLNTAAFVAFWFWITARETDKIWVTAKTSPSEPGSR